MPRFICTEKHAEDQQPCCGGDPKNVVKPSKGDPPLMCLKMFEDFFEETKLSPKQRATLLEDFAKTSIQPLRRANFRDPCWVPTGSIFDKAVLHVDLVSRIYPSSNTCKDTGNHIFDYASIICSRILGSKSLSEPSTDLKTSSPRDWPIFRHRFPIWKKCLLRLSSY